MPEGHGDLNFSNVPLMNDCIWQPYRHRAAAAKVFHPQVLFSLHRCLLTLSVSLLLLAVRIKIWTVDFSLI